MKRLTAFLAFAIFLGAGHSVANATTTTKSPDRLRTVKPIARPGGVQPDRNKRLQPRIKPGMLSHLCPEHLEKNPQTKTYMDYSCNFRFRLKCGAGEEIWRGRDNRGPAEVKVNATHNEISIEYYCMDKDNPEPALKGYRSLSEVPSVAQPAGPSRTRQPLKPGKPGKPRIRPGMSAFDCATYFRKHDVAAKGYSICHFDFRPRCAPGMKISNGGGALSRGWWYLNAFGDAYNLSYRCIRQQR